MWKIFALRNSRICCEKQKVVSQLVKSPNFMFSKKTAGFYTSDDYNPGFNQKIRKNNVISGENPLSFCIVGSGPAGFYLAKSLINWENKNIHIDIIDSNPHPFGLIRNGVAPDHQNMKKIQYDYDVVFQNPNCEFYGNITVGEDIQIDE